MSSWTLHCPKHGADCDMPHRLWPLVAANGETVGATQLALLLRARAGKSGMLVLQHTRNQVANKERMAARRLVERGLLSGPNYVKQAPLRNWRGAAVGGAPENPYTGVYSYTLTKRGRACWLRTRSTEQSKGAEQ